jgi:hypothetical protein
MQAHQVGGHEKYCAPTYLEDYFRTERGPPQWDGVEAGEEAYERAVMSDIECKAMCGLLESVC